MSGEAANFQPQTDLDFLIKEIKRHYNEFFEQKKNEMENYYYYLLHHPNADFSVSDSSTIYWHEEGSSRNI